jgi:hypothetical protein
MLAGMIDVRLLFVENCHVVVLPFLTLSLSDVAGIRTTAVRDGDHFVINGQKKWITGGAMAGTKN